jgi:hypothetical protein
MLSLRTLFFLLIGILVAGCGARPQVTPVTPIPTGQFRTAIAQTLDAQQNAVESPAAPSSTPIPPATDAPLPALPSSTPTPSPTPTAVTRTATPGISPSLTPTGLPQIPLAAIEITAPGALSKVVSPFPLRALLVPGDQGRVTVELLGEDGRVLTRQIVILNPNLGRKAGLAIDIVFEIPTESELGRLAVYRQDAFGRTTALSSVDLVLLSSGVSDFNVVVDTQANFVLDDPQPDALIQGGRVLVSGVARPDNPVGLVAELITEGGSILSQRVFAVPDADSDAYRPFVVDIPYSVDEATWVLLIIRERGGRIPGIAHLTSREILLSP